MKNAITGFILFGVSLVIVQIVATLIGVGSIFDMVKFPSGLLTDTGGLADCIETCNDDQEAIDACNRIVSSGSFSTYERQACLTDVNDTRTQCINNCENQYE